MSALERKPFLVSVRQKAFLKSDESLETAATTALQLLTDTLSEAATKDFAGFMPEEWRPAIGRSVEKIEHSQREIVQLVGRQANLSTSAALQLVAAVWQSLWENLPDEAMEKLLKQVPVRLANALKATRPGDKRIASLKN